MKKELKNQMLSYSWYRENPVKTGLLTIIGIYIMLWLIGLFYKPNDNLENIHFLGFLFWALIIIMAITPTLVTLYLYRSNAPYASYSKLFRRSILIGTLANCMSIIAIGTSNNAFDVSDELAIQAGWATILSLSFMVSLPLNALLSIPFVKHG